MIDISDIYIIRVINELGSLNRAAEELHISQPTLSKKLSRLEHRIKMKLFYRHSGGMVATEAAKYMLQESEGLEAQLRMVERRLQLMSQMVGGEVKIGVGPIVEQLILPDALFDFAAKDYNFSLKVISESADSLLDQLHQGYIDLAIGPFCSTELSDDFTAVLEVSEKMVCAVNPNHPLTQLSSELLNFKEISNYRIISPKVPNHMGRGILDIVKKVPLNLDITCDNYQIVKSIVSRSDYITVGPTSLFSQEFESGDLIQLDVTDTVHWQCSCIGKNEMLLMPAVQEVVNLFSKYMNKID